MKRIWIFFALCAAIAFVGSAGYLGLRSTQAQGTVTPEAPPTIAVAVCDVEQTITAPGELVNTREAQIEMPFSGKLDEVNAQAGETVEAGQVLAVIGGKEAYEAAVTDANLEVLQAQATLEELYDNAPLEAAQARVALVEAQKALDEAQKDRDRLNYPRASVATIDDAKARLALAEAILLAERKAYDAMSELPVEDPQRAEARLKLTQAEHEYANALATVNWYLGETTEEEITLAEAELERATAQLDQAQAAWDELKEGPDGLKIALAEAQVAAAQAALTSAREVLDQLTITAPFDGVILESSAQVGETIPQATPLFTINDPQSLEVLANVTEEDYPLLNPGQSVEAFFDARPDVTVEGSVERIIPRRIEGDHPRYHIYISLKEIPDGLADGMTSDTAITIAKRAGVLCLPRASVRASGGDTSIVKVWDGVQEVEREITIGLRGDTTIEILSGLTEGEQVVTR